MTEFSDRALDPHPQTVFLAYRNADGALVESDLPPDVVRDLATTGTVSLRVQDIMMTKLIEAITTNTEILKRIERHLAMGSDEIRGDLDVSFE